MSLLDFTVTVLGVLRTGSVRRMLRGADRSCRSAPAVCHRTGDSLLDHYTLSVSNSLSGRHWELDQGPAVPDSGTGHPTDIVQFGRMGSMGRSRFSSEVRERAVRMVEEHREAYASEWAVLQSVAPKLGCTAETLEVGAAGHSVTRDIGQA